MNQADMKKLLAMGSRLARERDMDDLLEYILKCMMDLAHCDAGTLYLLDDEALHFKIMRNDTLGTYIGGKGNEPRLPPVPLQKENVCALALIENRIIRIRDVKKSKDYDFSGPIRYDAMTGYNTQSMLVAPMRSREGNQIGVIQLINAMDSAGRVCEFKEELALVIESAAAQSAITIQNVRYIEEIKELFQSFVRVMSSAVDERTPYNGGHTRRMAGYGDRFLDYLNQQAARAGEPEPFSSADREELLMSVWLHDIGKLVTPLEVMNKMARLLPEQHSDFLHRMEVVRLRSEIDFLSGRISAGERDDVVRRTREAGQLVDSVNSVGFLPDERLAELNALAGLTYTGEDGGPHPWLTPEEHAMLSIRKGTLSDAERRIMEEHVTITGKLLSKIRFSRELSHVPQWAAAHHELLNGSGYPNHLSGDAIPAQVRIITILDVFDALVADDRPYKPGMPVERALSILRDMAEKEGKLDPELTRQFCQSRCWENPSPRKEGELRS